MPYKEAEKRRIYHREYDKKWRLKNLDKLREKDRRLASNKRAQLTIEEKLKIAEYQKKYREKHPEKFKYNSIKSKKYVELTKGERDHINAVRRKRYKEKRIQILKKLKLYRNKYPEIYRESSKKWAANNRERVKKNIKHFYNINPEKSSEYSKNKRARKWGNTEASFTIKEWQLMKEAYKYCCVYCHKEFKRLTQDHIIPLSKGGTHIGSNILPACQSCNSKKHANMWWSII